MSLREAATAAGTSKSTILRAIRAGRMSADRLDDGGYSIDPAELFRAYPPKAGATVQERAAHHSVGQDAPERGTPPEAGATPATVDLRICNARLEAELAAMRALLEAEKRRGEELREERDRWHAQAERLALPAPAAPDRAQASHSWWPWRRRA